MEDICPRKALLCIPVSIINVINLFAKHLTTTAAHGRLQAQRVAHLDYNGRLEEGIHVYRIKNFTA